MKMTNMEINLVEAKWSLWLVELGIMRKTTTHWDIRYMQLKLAWTRKIFSKKFHCAFELDGSHWMKRERNFTHHDTNYSV